MNQDTLQPRSPYSAGKLYTKGPRILPPYSEFWTGQFLPLIQQIHTPVENWVSVAHGVARNQFGASCDDIDGSLSGILWHK